MAPSSRISSWVPLLLGDVTWPGTANTSRYSPSAYLAVMREPLLAAASTTTVPRDKPAIIRFRWGNSPCAAGVPGGYSDRSSPCDAIFLYKRVCSRGYITSIPQPRTAIVLPGPFSAPSWASPSMPLAIPLTTHTSARDSPSAIREAVLLP
ncbi:hypothetical protein D3C75_924070 [compost metagenome]